MKASELRIGNWIQDIDPGDCYQVDEIKKNGFVAGPLGVFPAGMEFDYGITITEEWLLKFGFEKVCVSRQDDSFAWEIVLNQKQIMLFYFPEMMIKIKHSFQDKKYPFVHQLQNLYYALTREELTITN